MLRPYWIKTFGPHHGLVSPIGVGITAQSVEDAVSLFHAAFGNEHEIQSIEAIMDMRQIDQGHVAPNMGNALVRGVWYPRGFDHISQS
jgi:hypothetical protein